MLYLMFFSRNHWKGFKGECRSSGFSVIRYDIFLKVNTLVVFEMDFSLLVTCYLL